MNKKALSEMIAYVLLIVIAVSLSIFVYGWLNRYVPKQSLECEDNVALIIDDYSCNSSENTTDITVRNKGLFNVDGFFIRISNNSQAAVIPLIGEGVIDGQVFLKFKPDQVLMKTFNYTGYNQITNIEIEPYIIREIKRKNQTVLCSNAVINIKAEDEKGCGIGGRVVGGDGGGETPQGTCGSQDALAGAICGISASGSLSDGKNACANKIYSCPVGCYDPVNPPTTCECPACPGVYPDSMNCISDTDGGMIPLQTIISISTDKTFQISSMIIGNPSGTMTITGNGCDNSNPVQITLPASGSYTCCP